MDQAKPSQALLTWDIELSNVPAEKRKQRAKRRQQKTPERGMGVLRSSSVGHLGRRIAQQTAWPVLLWDIAFGPEYDLTRLKTHPVCGLMFFSCAVLPFAMENPARSRIWLLCPSVKWLLKRRNVSFETVHYCAFGTRWKKPTSFLGTHLDLSVLSRMTPMS